MKIEQIKTLIKDYRNILNSGNSVTLNTLFQDAEVISFESARFTKLNFSHMYLFLGVENNKLVGFLVHDDRCYTKWDDTTEVFMAKFVKSKDSNVQDYSNNFKNTVSDQHENYISVTVASKRIDTWKKTKRRWISNMVSKNTMVRFFEIPTAGFANAQVNHFSLGINDYTDVKLDISSHVDLVIENQTGLYDTVRPVPPFPRVTRWPK